MEKVNIEPFLVMGIEVRTTNENQKAAQDIVLLWQRFFGEQLLMQIPNRIDDTIYCLYTDYEGDHTQPYTTIIGCRVNSLESVPENMTARSFHGGSYIRMTVKGNLADNIVINQWYNIWNMDLDRAYTVDFEVFGNKAQDPTQTEVDIFIAVK